MEGLSIVLEFNYFYINNGFYHQIKGTAMGTIFPVVGSNLTVGYFEKKNVCYFATDLSKEFVGFFIRNFFQFLDDVFS